MGKLRIPDAARGFTYVQDTTPSGAVQQGETWYDTSTGKAYVYTEIGWTPTRGQSTCWEKNPLYIKIEPASGVINEDGGSVSFTVTLKNLDVGTCGPVTFNLTVVDSNSDDFEPSTLSATSVTLSPYQETTITLTVTDKIGEVVGTGRNDVYIEATAAEHPTSRSNTITVELAGAAAECTPQAPSVSISPATQTISEAGGEANYSVTITNNDPTSCAATTFTLTVTDSNTDNFEPSILSQTSVTLSPGDSTSVTLTVKDKADDTPGTPVSNNTYVTVTSDVHGSVDSNTVTTTLEGAAMGWNYGYVCGGSGSVLSTIDRFHFPFNSGAASHVGNLSGGRRWLAANNSSQYGYVCGGYDGSRVFSTIDRFQFPFDSGTASHVGNLSRSLYALAANNSSQHGYVCGGNSGSNYFPTIDRFQFPFDSGTASHVGNLSRSRGWPVANNSSQHGYVCGGQSGRHFSTIDRFHFPFNSGAASHVGNLSVGRIGLAANNSSQYGYVCGGSGSVLSTIDRFQFPFDSGTASHVGNLSRSRSGLAANNSSQYGYVCGGSGSVLSTIDRFQFPFNSGTASHVGNLSRSRSELAATDTTDFIQMFV